MRIEVEKRVTTKKLYVEISIVFFFQAEDGIRDKGM